MKPIDQERWSEGRVEQLHRWTDRLFSVQVRADIQPFQAGQFTKLGLVIGDEFVTRPYSFVNSPRDDLLEFYFITVEDGPLTGQFIRLQPGDPVYVMRKPSGFLTLNEIPEAEHLWVMSTGTGIGPFLSILGTQEPWERFDHVVLVHAVRTVSELNYSERIRETSELHPDKFRFVPFVSRESCEGALPGRVPVAIEDGSLQDLTGLKIRPEQSQVMICGNPDMVKDTSEVLQQRGLERNRRRTPGHITVENYW